MISCKPINNVIFTFVMHSGRCQNEVYMDSTRIHRKEPLFLRFEILYLANIDFTVIK